MKIFGIEFKTKKELKEEIAALKDELTTMRQMFPFTLSQTVYDVQLRNEKGRYARKNASLEHSRINKIVVDEKNYFGLVERYQRQDVFMDYGAADAFLVDVCSKSE
jgi:hypothetical protein